LLTVFSGLATCKSHTHKKHDVTNTQPLHVSESKVIAQNNTARRSIWDTIDGANISVQNSVHSYSAKSDVAGQVADPSRRDIWDTINNANISVENHVHSYATLKSEINTKKSETKKTVTANSTRRDVWDLIKGANITVVNSVHSQTVKKCKGHCPKPLHHVVSKFHGSKPHHVKEEVGLRRSSIVNAVAQKRDEEPGRGDEEPGPDPMAGPDPVSVRGKSPSDVAA